MERQVQQVWYQLPLFIALLSLIMGFLGGQFSGWLERRWEREAKAESLKVAFRGEINAIRNMLRVPATSAAKAWENGRVLKEYKVDYPRVIFEANAGHLGDLREHVLVGQISMLYSSLERTQEIGRRLQNGVYGPEGFPQYVQLLVSCFDMAVHLDMRLTEQTKHFIELDWSVKVTGMDAEDHNWAVGVLKKLQEAKR